LENAGGDSKKRDPGRHNGAPSKNRPHRTLERRALAIVEKRREESAKSGRGRKESRSRGKHALFGEGKFTEREFVPAVHSGKKGACGSQKTWGLGGGRKSGKTSPNWAAGKKVLKTTNTGKTALQKNTPISPSPQNKPPPGVKKKKGNWPRHAASEPGSASFDEKGGKREEVSLSTNLMWKKNLLPESRKTTPSGVLAQ